MQVVINKCFLPNPEKNSAQIRLVVFEKNANNSKNDVTDPKATRLGYSNNQLKDSFKLVSGSLKLIFNLLTV